MGKLRIEVRDLHSFDQQLGSSRPPRAEADKLNTPVRWVESQRAYLGPSG